MRLYTHECTCILCLPQKKMSNLWACHTTTRQSSSKFFHFSQVSKQDWMDQTAAPIKQNRHNKPPKEWFPHSSQGTFPSLSCPTCQVSRHRSFSWRDTVTHYCVSGAKPHVHVSSANSNLCRPHPRKPAKDTFKQSRINCPWKN